VPRIERDGARQRGTRFLQSLEGVERGAAHEM
jgi:hypothetical protein